MEVDRLLVYEYIKNGELHDHLHRRSSPSPVMVSWKMRIDVLLGVSRAIEHLHCHAVPPVIHRDIKSANILFDSSWVPRLSDFGLSVHWDPTKEDDTRRRRHVRVRRPGIPQNRASKAGERHLQLGCVDARGSDGEEGIC
ncbi:hypothetical protein ACQ4PT_069915 [Festuca glaucescens]